MGELINRDSRILSSSTGPATRSVVPLVDLSSTASTLELSCESLVANKSCARGTLQVRELCIKAVRKAKRGDGSGAVSWEQGRAKEIDMRVSHAVSRLSVHEGRRRDFGELVKVEEVVHDNRLVVD